MKIPVAFLNQFVSLVGNRKIEEKKSKNRKIVGEHRFSLARMSTKLQPDSKIGSDMPLEFSFVQMA